MLHFFQADSNIELDSRGNIIVDEFMQTNVEGVFAAGDIASFPLSLPILDPGILLFFARFKSDYALKTRFLPSFSIGRQIS